MPDKLNYLLLGLIALVGFSVVAVIVWRRNSQKQPEEKIISLVFLLREPRTLELPQVRSAAERAFGRRIKEENANLTVIATDHPSCFIVSTPAVTLGLTNVNGAYVNDVGAAADQLRNFLCKKAMQEHRAWVAVDQIGEPPKGGAAVSYGYIGKLMAEMANDDCLAIYCTQTGQMNSYEKDLLPLLRGPNPLKALSQPRKDMTEQIDDRDEELEKAEPEARRRWPEFMSAFKMRRPMQGFAVKVPFHEGEKSEYMWVEVAKLDGDKIYGKLVNEPEWVSNLKLNDTVTVSLDDLKDWIYSDGKQMVGGFTAKVLEKR